MFSHSVRTVPFPPKWPWILQLINTDPLMKLLLLFCHVINEIRLWGVGNISCLMCFSSWQAILEDEANKQMKMCFLYKSCSKALRFQDKNICHSRPNRPHWPPCCINTSQPFTPLLAVCMLYHFIFPLGEGDALLTRVWRRSGCRIRRIRCRLSFRLSGRNSAISWGRRKSSSQQRSVKYS